MRKRKSYRLPSGKFTSSEIRYVREWRSLGNKLVKALGGDRQVYGFDPDFAVAVDGFKGPSESYSVWLAHRIVELYNMSKVNEFHRCDKCKIIERKDVNYINL